MINLYDKDNKAISYKPTAIKYELQPNGTALCTYNTPKNLNALTHAQRWDMFAILDHAARDDNVKCLVWTGEGRAFSSGAALGAGAATSTIPEDIQDAMTERNMGPDGTMVLKAMTLAFWDFPKPSLCAVNGLAVGGAANIALVNFHDLVYCAEEARFKYPFANLGFTPELGSSMMMPQLVGMCRAKEIMFLGDWFSAKEAKEMGLVNKVFKKEDLIPEVMKIADRLCNTHPGSLSNSKKILNNTMRKQLATALDEEQEQFMQVFRDTGGPSGVAKWKKKHMSALKAKL
jgi:enoyl-CoA hydratase/carnithine racemase